MITFLWMLYLALELFITIYFITGVTRRIITGYDKDGKEAAVIMIWLISLLWSIWYHYYLH